MAKPDIIVAAGGLEALQVLAARMPAGLRASFCVVLHIASGLNAMVAGFCERFCRADAGPPGRGR